MEQDDRRLLLELRRLRELDAKRWEHPQGGQEHERLWQAVEAQRRLVQRWAVEGFAAAGRRTLPR
jgi:hypothetical protein